MGPEVFKLSAAFSAFSLNPAAMMEKITNAHEAKYYGLCRFAVVNGESWDFDVDGEKNEWEQKTKSGRFDFSEEVRTPEWRSNIP